MEYLFLYTPWLQLSICPCTKWEWSIEQVEMLYRNAQSWQLWYTFVLLKFEN